METNRNKPKILIIDDESQIRRLLNITLEANHFRVFEAENSHDGLLSASMNQPDVILLDLGLPDQDGLTTLRHLREWSRVPIIVLTVQDDEGVKIDALDHGADDYVTKPFNTGELLARIRVALRHSLKTGESPVLTNGPLWIDLNAHVVKVNNEEAKLTATEYNLLALFMRNRGKVLTHTHICREIWGNPYADNAQVLRVHIAQLRKKIEQNPSIPALLVTEPAVGYRLREDSPGDEIKRMEFE
jgi:two-component system, OmpR family, KDP operon response regulator KdpE